MFQQVHCTHSGALLARATAPPKRKPLDEWDAEYDRGKAKKVKAPAADGEAGGRNMFQDALTSKDGRASGASGCHGRNHQHDHGRGGRGHRGVQHRGRGGRSPHAGGGRGGGRVAAAVVGVAGVVGVEAGTDLAYVYTASVL